jgi:hypothetical protein
MRFRWFAAVAVVLLAGGFASAQPKDAGPTVEVRVRSVNDLVDKFEYVAGLAGKDDAINQVRELIKVLSEDGKGVEGIDPKKPFGAYALLGKDVQASIFVLMIPIADEERFFDALKRRLDLTAEKSDGGTYKIAVQKIDEVHLRFLNGYAYVAQKVKDLDPKALIAPKAYFAKDDGSVASLLVHIDRIPDDLKTFALGQFELGLNEERKKNADNEKAAEQKLKALVLDSIMAGTKGLADDGKELSIKLFVDSKTDEITVEVALTAKSGSPMAKNFAALGRKTSLPAGIVGSVANPVARGNVSVAVTDGMKKDYAAAIDELLAQAVKEAPGDAEAVVKDLVAVVAPTLKAGELDAAAALIGPDAKGRYQLLAAAGVKEGKGVEKFLKDVVKMYGPQIEEKVTIKFDVETVGDFTLHRFDLKEAPEKFEQAFGAKSVWLAVSDKTIAVSVEPEGATIKKALKAKAAPVALASVELSAAKLVQLTQPDLKPDELKALLKDAFGEGAPDGKDTLSFRVEGGDKLSAKFKVKGKAIKLFAGLGVLKGQ